MVTAYVKETFEERICGIGIMKCLNCGRQFENPRWPSAWKTRLGIYKKTGQINGHLYGQFTCSVRCNHAIVKIRGDVFRKKEAA